MQLWQMDVMGGVLLDDGTELKVLTGIDDHSRFCVAAGLVTRATSKAVCEVFAASLRRHGIPDEIMTDNGKVFTARFGPYPTEVAFDRICRENGISHRHTGVRSPTTTGKIERFHQSLRKEFLADRTFPCLEEAQAELDAWVSDYNTNRPPPGPGHGHPGRAFPPGPACQGCLLDPGGRDRGPSRPVDPSARCLLWGDLGGQSDLLRGQRLQGPTGGRLHGRDGDPGLEQESPHQDGGQAERRSGTQGPS